MRVRRSGTAGDGPERAQIVRVNSYVFDSCLRTLFGGYRHKTLERIYEQTLPMRFIATTSQKPVGFQHTIQHAADSLQAAPEENCHTARQ